MPPLATRSSCLPCSRILPPSKTMILSASRMIASRCATVMTLFSVVTSADRPLYSRFGFVVQMRGHFVQRQHRRIFQERSGDRDALLLTARKSSATFSDFRLESTGNRGKQFLRFRLNHRVDNFSLGRLRLAVSNVRANRSRKQIYILADQADRGAQILKIQFPNILPVYENSSIVNIVKRISRRSSVVLPEPVRPTIPNFSPGCSRKETPLEHSFRAVAERDVFKYHFATNGCE